MNSEFSVVLSSWIKEATSFGKLPDGISIEEWIAERVADWFKGKIIDDIEALETTAYALRENLRRIGSWDKSELGEAMHELVHLDKNIADLRMSLGPQEESNDDKVDR